MNQKRFQESNVIPQHLTNQISEGIHGLGYERSFSSHSENGQYETLKNEDHVGFEDARVTKLLFETHRLIEHVRLQFIIIITMILIIDFDDQYFISELEDDTFLWIVFALNSILLLFTYLTYHIKFHYFKATKLIPLNMGFHKSDFFYPFLLEFLTFIPIPNVFSKNIQFEFTLYRVEGVFYFTLNDLLFLWTCLRGINLMFILLRLSHLYNSQVYRLSLYFGFKVKWSFTFKSLANEEPVLVISTIFTIQACYLTLALWIVERPYMRDDNSDTMQLLKHSFYETMLALIRYSYEEYEPYTVYGKIVLSFTQYSGFATTSLLIAAIAKRFYMESNQYNSYILLARLQASHEMLVITQAIGEQFYYLTKYPINPFSNGRAKLCLANLKKFFHKKRNYHNTVAELTEQLFNRKLKDFKLLLQDYQEICKLIREQQKETYQFQASFSGDRVRKTEFESLLKSNQDLLLLIIKDDGMVALWNQLYQKHVDSIFMGFIDCREANDLCTELGIQNTPQLLYVNKTEKALIYFDGQWNSDSITEWLIGDQIHSEKEYEINIQVDQPNINQNIQWVTDVGNEDQLHNSQLNENHDLNEINHHHDHHSDNIEKIKYEELQQLILLNEQLSYKADKFRRDIDLMKHQTNMLNTSFMIELNRQETTINFTIYLYSSGMIALICVLFTWKKINVIQKKQSILVQ
ncbi:unnamed protein product [Paramecium sonneborni]|uniref:Uncharacterized protein n=1 Tax=Paramecium sonneborni TaxID=65129 RepID=A0A8S1RG61_9CILI|nr:unnamed protein product [Paramecium sonneborni]